MTDSTIRFADMAGIHERTVEALERRGMGSAFPVQAAVVPIALTGKDVLVQSPTGSGKTIAFGLPLIERIPKNTKRPFALILVPTRELAVQVCEDLAPLSTGKQLETIAVYGGAPIHRQAQAARTAAIVVATPGRLDDLMRQRKIDLRGVQALVLDEADRMLDMGFQPQVDAIVDQLGNGERQTMLFSATLEGQVAKIAASYTKDAETVRLTTAPGAGGKIEHVVWGTTGSTKVDTVVEALEDERDLAVIFVRTKRSADLLNSRLRGFGVKSTAIHGGMTQRERLNEYRRFQKAECDVLVATDVFARGMDLDRITVVINYDIPEDADTYQHRSGRTGRAGRTGTCITMMLPNQRTQLRRMLRTAGLPLTLFDAVRRTKQTNRQPLPEDQHFTPPTTMKHTARASKQPYERGNRGTQNDRRGAIQRPGQRRANPGTPGHDGAARSHAVKPGQGGPGDGSVLSYDPAKGFGFIKPDNGGADVFFHRSAIGGQDTSAFQRGVRVAFAEQEHQRGTRAVDVRPLTPA